MELDRVDIPFLTATLKLKYYNYSFTNLLLSPFIIHGLDVFCVYLCNLLVDGYFATNICIVPIE